jgi:hypothetical protein
LVVEQEGHGVREDFAQQSGCQMPEVARPHPLYRIALCELAEDGVDAVAKATEQGASLDIGITLFGGVGSQKLDTPPGQFLPNWRRVVVAIPNDDPGGSFDEFGEQVDLVGVGRSYRQASDHPRPANPHVYSKAVEGLSEQCILAESGFSFEALAAVGSGEQTRWQGQRVADGEASIVRSESKEFLPKVFLSLPEVGCLPGKGGPMYLAEGRKPFSVVPLEEAVDALVGV